MFCSNDSGLVCGKTSDILVCLVMQHDLVYSFILFFMYFNCINHRGRVRLNFQGLGFRFRRQDNTAGIIKKTSWNWLACLPLIFSDSVILLLRLLNLIPSMNDYWRPGCAHLSGHARSCATCAIMAVTVLKIGDYHTIKFQIFVCKVFMCRLISDWLRLTEESS